jgi:hypothetical protein
MSPSRFGWKVAQGVLSVVNHQIRTLQKSHMPPVSVVYRCRAGAGLKGKEGVRFVIGGINQRDAVYFQTVPEGEGGMV